MGWIIYKQEQYPEFDQDIFDSLQDIVNTMRRKSSGGSEVHICDHQSKIWYGKIIKGS